MPGEAVIVGSGAAGATAAWELARCGWSVTVLERGRNLRPGFGEVASSELGTFYSSDEVKTSRALGFPDPLLEPYSIRSQEEASNGAARRDSGAYNQLGAAVGGTSMHYNAKFPRFWSQDFHQLSDLGPVEGANLADWPLTYDDLAPFYDEVEYHVGVQGDVERMPARTLEEAPRERQFVMPPNPTGYAAQLLAEGADRAGYTTFPYPAAVNSEEFDGRPACNSCGLCSSFGCPINARGDAMVSWLNPAVRTGRVRVIDRAFVHRIDTSRDGRRATAVRYRDHEGNERAVPGDVVLVAASPVNTARLLLLSANGAHPNGLGNRSDQLGRNIMYHAFTLAGAIFPEDVQPLRAQSTTLQIDDFVGPFTGPEVAALGVPYIKGGLVQVGSGVPLLMEAQMLAGYADWGIQHKQLMRFGPFHLRVAGSQLVGEDLPQEANRVDLDPDVTDYQGFPAARITYSPHRHEQAAALYLGPRLEEYHALAPGATGAGIIPYPLISDVMSQTAHIAGTARMGSDADTSVTDADGRLHEVDNLYVVDASTFPTFPGHNPTLTIMANSLRIARKIGCGSASPVDDAVSERAEDDHRASLPPTGGGVAAAALPLAAGAAAFARRHDRGDTRREDDP